MNQGRIIVITGAPGTGKTTTASAVAKESDLEKSVHMHTDDFYHYLSKGAIDTTTHSIKDTVSAVKEKIVSGTALLF
jgi:uridine kinase